MSPMYVLVDLNYIKNILTKDFHCFTDRGFFHNEKDDPISNHIFLMSGTNKWKRMRAKLTPIFSSSRMKQMFQTLVECLPHLLSSLEADRVKDQPTNIKDTMSSFTMDVIGSCVFGLDLDIFNYENSPFRFFGKKMFTSTSFTIVKRIFCTIFPQCGEESRRVRDPQGRVRVLHGSGQRYREVQRTKQLQSSRLHPVVDLFEEQRRCFDR
jgi:cytochrome P450 family 6